MLVTDAGAITGEVSLEVAVSVSVVSLQQSSAAGGAVKSLI